MIDSTVLRGVVGAGAAGAAELLVEADAGGEGEQPCRDAGGEIVQRAGAVALEREDVFEAAEDGLNALADGGEAGAGLGFVAAGGAQDGGAEGGDGGFEVAAGGGFVADDRLAALEAAREQRQRDLAFGPVGGGKGGGAWGAVGRAQQVQAHAPEPAGMAARVAVAAGVGELRATGRLDGAAALDGGGVEQQQAVLAGRAAGREDADQPLDRVAKPGAPLVQRALAGQQREQVAQLAARGAQEAPVGGGSPSPPARRTASRFRRR